MRLLISLNAASGVLAENPYRRIVLVRSAVDERVISKMQYVLQLCMLRVASTLLISRFCMK